jgi:hypothetical protein
VALATPKPSEEPAARGAPARAPSPRRQYSATRTAEDEVRRRVSRVFVDNLLEEQNGRDAARGNTRAVRDVDVNRSVNAADRTD